MGYFAENFDIVLEQVQPINEAYFGKTKEILAIEKAVHDLRTPYLSDELININMYTPKINQDPNKKKLQNAIKNAFGFSDVGLSIAAKKDFNACTMSASGLLDVDVDKLISSAKKVSSKEKGFKYDPKDGVILVMSINSGLFLDSNCSDGEVMAIILHEIGHNFSQIANRDVYKVSKYPSLFQALRTIASIVNDVISFVANTMKGVAQPFDIVQDIVISICTSFLSTNKFKRFNIKIQDFINKYINKVEKENPNAAKAIGAVSTGTSATLDILNSINYLKSFRILLPNYKINIMSTSLNLLNSLVRKISRPDGYSNEKFADQFPVMYGYGPEFISSMQKISNSSSNSAEELLDRSIPIIPAILDIYYLPIYILESEIDEHPLEIDRINMSMDEINKEINDMNLDSKTRAKIQKDAKEMKNELDKYKSEMLKLGTGTGRNIYQAALNFIFNGSIKSKVKARHVNDDINKFFDEL